MTFTDFKKKYPTPRIITHTDLDGYASAAIMTRFFVNIFGYSMDDISVSHVSPSDEFKFEDGLTIITDLSLTSGNNWKNAVIYSMRDDNIVLWIDHHQSSMDLLKKYPTVSHVPHQVHTGVCATLICWRIYELGLRLFNDLTKFRSFDFVEWFETLPMRKIINDVGFELLDNSSIEAQYRLCKQTPNFYGEHCDKVPYAVQLTNDWDVFQLRDRNSIYFNNAFDSCLDFPHDVKDPFYSIFVKPDCSVSNTLWSIWDSSNHMMELHRFIKYGSNGLNAQRYFYLRSLLRNGYMLKMIPNKDLIKAKPKFAKLETAEFVCVNQNDVNVKIAAPNLTSGHSWFIGYTDKEEYLAYTIYANHISTYGFGANDVASLFGGGGHPECSGFVTKERLRGTVGVNGDVTIVTSPLSDQIKALIRKDLKEAASKCKSVFDLEDTNKDFIKERTWFIDGCVY